MRIAFIYDAVYPWEKGGAQKRVWELARRLAVDHDVHLFGMHYWDGPAVVTRKGVTMHGVCEPMDLYNDGRRSIRQAIRFALAVTRPLLNKRFDIIDCQEFPYFPCFTAKLHELARDSELVVTWYEVWDGYWYDYLGLKGAAGRMIERVATTLPDTIIPISDAIAEDVRRIQLQNNDISVVPNGVEFDSIRSVEPAEADWDVVYAGRLAEHKNVDLLIEAVERTAIRLDRSISCGIIGDGPEREALETRAEAIDGPAEITMLGFLEKHTDVISHLAAGTVFVLPSTREGFPNTILEANACGVPSVVVEGSMNGATAVVEDGVTGFVTEPSVAAIGDAIETLLSDSDRQAEMSKAVTEFAAAHDWNNIVDQLEAAYLQALD